MKKTLWIPFLVFLVMAATAIWYVHKKTPEIKSNEGQPQQSVEAILDERLKQAGKHLETPLGKAIVLKNWNEVNKIFDPKTQYLELASILQALFIENKIKDFNLAEKDLLLGLSLNALDKRTERDAHLAGLLVTEIERLPSPRHDSAYFKKLMAWALDSKELSVKRRVAIEKLALQDATPDERAIKVFYKSLLSDDSAGLSRKEWIQNVDAIRNQSAHKQAIEFLAKNIKKIPVEDQSQALVVISRAPEAALPQVKTMVFHFLKSNDASQLEGALRSLSNLARKNLLDDSEKKKVLNDLNSIPATGMNPFIEAKRQELLKLLTSSTKES